MAKRTMKTNPMAAATSLILSVLLSAALLPSTLWADEGDPATTPPSAEGDSGSDTSPDEGAGQQEEPPAPPDGGSGDAPADDGAGDDGVPSYDDDSDDAGSGQVSDGGENQPTDGDSADGRDQKDSSADDGEKPDGVAKSEEADADDKDESEKESSDEEVSSWARKRIESAQSSIGDSNAAMGQLPGALGSLRSAQAAFDGAYDEMEATEEELAELDARLKKARKRSAIARPAAEGAQAELVGIENAEPHTFAVKHGISLMEAKMRLDQLRQIAEGAGAVADKADREIADSQTRKDELSDQLAQQRQAVEEALVQANDCAFEAERCCSEARSGEVAAQEALAELGDGIKAADEVRRDMEATKDSHDGVRSAAYGELDAWYNDLDERVGAEEGRLTFGAGLDFAMDEKEFIAKWGAAIDAYYEELGGTPLSGYGEQMAREAWEWKIDPRLCAAVSFTESGGGRACIRNCNAWGWGAADTDPYNLASEWGSWEEAITAWHTGMGTNGMGLATARCVDELGSSYAGAPHWTVNVMTAMKRIDEIARSQAQERAPELSVASR